MARYQAHAQPLKNWEKQRTGKPVMSLIWHRDADGLCADIGLHRVTVGRLLPTAEARFIAWRGVDPPVAVMSGTKGSMADAMVAAEKAIVRRLLVEK